MASGAAYFNPGASQPGATSIGGPSVKFAVDSFNFGVDQHMLQPDPWARRHRANFRRVCAEMVDQEKLDIMFGCELGGSGKGFRFASISAKGILVESFSDISCAVVDNYIALCSFRDPAVVLHAPPVKFTILVGTRPVHAVITRFNILRYDGGDSPQTVAHMVAGNLHTVCGDKPPARSTRRRVLQLLREQLETYAAPHPQVPVVRLMVGDDKMSTAEARQALQQKTQDNPLWEVFPALENGRGSLGP